MQMHFVTLPFGCLIKQSPVQYVDRNWRALNGIDRYMCGVNLLQTLPRSVVACHVWNAPFCQVCCIGRCVAFDPTYRCSAPTGYRWQFAFINYLYRLWIQLLFKNNLLFMKGKTVVGAAAADIARSSGCWCIYGLIFLCAFHILLPLARTFTAPNQSGMCRCRRRRRRRHWVKWIFIHFWIASRASLFMNAMMHGLHYDCVSIQLTTTTVVLQWRNPVAMWLLTFMANVLWQGGKTK